MVPHTLRCPYIARRYREHVCEGIASYVKGLYPSHGSHGEGWGPEKHQCRWMKNFKKAKPRGKTMVTCGWWERGFLLPFSILVFLFLSVYYTSIMVSIGIFKKLFEKRLN